MSDAGALQTLGNINTHTRTHFQPLEVEARFSPRAYHPLTRSVLDPFFFTLWRR